MSARTHLLLLALLGAASPALRAETPLASLPYTPGLDVSAMDRSAEPCVDFYRFACGGWMRNNPIPPDESRWSVYGKLARENQRFLWGILEDLAKRSAGRSATQQKIGDYFAACMDEAAVEKSSARPLKPHLEQIFAMKSKRDLPAVLARLHLVTGSSGPYFVFSSNQDFADSTSVIAFAGAGGLGLPDRDFYTKDDDKSRELRTRYAAHVDRPGAAGREAAKVMEIETKLARASLTRTQRRDPYQLFHKMDARGLKALTPGFDWDLYLKTAGLPGLNAFNVTEPEFFRELDRQWRSIALADIKTYLRWHAAHASAPFLSSAFVNEDFDFFGKTLYGVPELKPRWKRCVALVDAQLGEALGQEFVSRAFSPELKQKTLHMTKQIEQAMEDDLNRIEWMSAATQQKALEKLHAIVNKIGYPDKWRDYGPVDVRRDDFAGNVARANLFESRRRLAKIGKPVDRGEWSMTPPTVNAYYNPHLNDINFAAGVLQPPLYDPKMDDAPNYGNTGGTIGHELTHGFDDEGRHFDARGNLKDWWTEKDAREFNDRAQCIVDQYAQYTIVDDIRINSRLTEGEDIADLGGLVLAWLAWKAETAGTEPESRDGFTPEQRFFVGYAQWACESNRPEDLRARALTDAHSPGKYRVNGLVVNMPEFERAFSCKAGAPMVRENRCRVW